MQVSVMPKTLRLCPPKAPPSSASLLSPAPRLPPAPLWPTTETWSSSISTLCEATAALTAATNFARSNERQGPSENSVGAAITSGVTLPPSISLFASFPTWIPFSSSDGCSLCDLPLIPCSAIKSGRGPLRKACGCAQTRAVLPPNWKSTPSSKSGPCPSAPPVLWCGSSFGPSCLASALGGLTSSASSSCVSPSSVTSTSGALRSAACTYV